MPENTNQLIKMISEEVLRLVEKIDAADSFALKPLYLAGGMADNLIDTDAAKHALEISEAIDNSRADLTIIRDQLLDVL